jgi:AcrR family transcriptional regulator
VKSPIPVRERTRHDIIAQAIRLFTEKGYDSTSLQDIASAVGCSKAAVLYHFPNKSAVYTAAVSPATEAIGELAERLARLTPGPETIRARIAGLADLATRFRALGALLPETMPRRGSHSELDELFQRAQALPGLLLDPADPNSPAMVAFALAGMAAFCRDPGYLNDDPEQPPDETLREDLTCALTRILLPNSPQRSGNLANG